MSHRRLRAVVRAELAASRCSLAVAALATLGSTAAALLAPWPLKIVFDHVLLAEPLPEGQGSLRPVTEAGEGVALAVPAVAMVVLALARAGLMSLQLDLTTRVGDGVMRAIQRALFAHLQRLSLSFHAKARAGELLARVTGDATALRDVIVSDAAPTGLEADSEATVQQALDRLMAGRTCVTITHDLATCAGADRVLVLERGRIAGHGTHAELLATSLPYRRLATRASQDRLQAAPKALEHAR